MRLNRNVYFVWMVIIIAALLSSCGVRKVQSDKSSTYNKNEAQTASQTDTKSKEESTTTEEVKETSDEANDITTTETTKTYNPDGSINSEHTKTTVDKSKKNTTSNRKFTRKVITTTETHAIEKKYTLQIVKTMTKHRNVDKDSTWVKNMGGSVTLLIGLAIVVFAVFAYFFWKRKTKIF